MAQLKNNSTADGGTIWNEGNDGSGSGLDAYSVDGVSYEDFSRHNPVSHTGTSVDFTAGWYTFAWTNNARATGRLGLRDTDSGKHQYCVFHAAHEYGYSSITCLHYGVYSGRGFRYIRVKTGGVYDGALVQVYMETNNRVAGYLLGDNYQTNGWYLTNGFLDDSTDPGLNGFANLSGGPQIDVAVIGNGGMGCSGGVRSNSTFTKGSGTFDIPHPDPQKQDWRLRHSFVESPTRGDNIYRYQIKSKSDGEAVTVDLPDYWKYLNEDQQVWVTGKDHFAKGYGSVDQTQSKLTIFCEKSGEYNVLLMGTRKDSVARESWDSIGDVEYKTSNGEVTNGDTEK